MSADGVIQQVLPIPAVAGFTSSDPKALQQCAQQPVLTTQEVTWATAEGLRTGLSASLMRHMLRIVR